MTKLKSIIIGCGAIARVHLAALADLDNVEVVGVCDISAVKARAIAERFGISRWHTNYSQFLSDVQPDLVHITASPSAHFPIAKTCLGAGLNVLCEKPVTHDYAEFCQLRDLAARNHCMLVEVQNFRYHSSIQRLKHLVESGMVGDVVELQINLVQNLYEKGSAYVDGNLPHHALMLRGGIIGDFLPHVAYLTRLFIGPVTDLRTIWMKVASPSPLPVDEFRCLMKGAGATAFVEFSANSQPNGFWVRLHGTKMCAEVDLFQPPRMTIRRVRRGEPALMTLIDGIVEARDVAKGAFAGFWRKLGGKSRYDGFPELISKIYHAIEMKEEQPISLDELADTVRLVEQFTAGDFEI